VPTCGGRRISSSGPFSPEPLVHRQHAHRLRHPRRRPEHCLPLWNSNSLLGILWGALFFGELRGATGGQRTRVIGGTIAMCIGATLLALASTHEAARGSAARGVIAALGAGALWGTMYIPYRKAYLTGMSPLAFVTFFTVGELGCMGIIALAINGASATAIELNAARGVLFWLMLGGFVWVMGDLFQQYAAKYVGISRGIPLSNTNQLWGLLWGTLVFGELRRSGVSLPLVVAGSLIMAIGAAAVALATTGDTEHDRWREAAEREARRYGVDLEWVRARLVGTPLRPCEAHLDRLDPGGNFYGTVRFRGTPLRAPGTRHGPALGGNTVYRHGRPAGCCRHRLVEDDTVQLTVCFGRMCQGPPRGGLAEDTGRGRLQATASCV
jgi:glucose uptake protein GlcU